MPQVSGTVIILEDFKGDINHEAFKLHEVVNCQSGLALIRRNKGQSYIDDEIFLKNFAKILKDENIHTGETKTKQFHYVVDDFDSAVVEW